MLLSCWSTKGGTGTTVVAAALGLLLARTHGAAVLADLAGDLPAALGNVDPDARTPGLAGWLRSAPDVPPDALARLAEPVGPGLALLRRGPGALDAAHADDLAALLNADRRTVVADCGRLDLVESEVEASAAAAAGVGSAAGIADPATTDPHRADAAAAVAAGATRSLLVLRPCFLALRRARSMPFAPTGIVLVAEDGRAIDAAAVEDALGVPVLARVRVRDDIARAVDAGLLARRLPKSLERDLRHAA